MNLTGLLVDCYAKFRPVDSFERYLIDLYYSTSVFTFGILGFIRNLLDLDWFVSLVDFLNSLFDINGLGFSKFNCLFSVHIDQLFKSSLTCLFSNSSDFWFIDLGWFVSLVDCLNSLFDINCLGFSKFNRLFSVHIGQLFKSSLACLFSNSWDFWSLHLFYLGLRSNFLTNISHKIFYHRREVIGGNGSAFFGEKTSFQFIDDFTVMLTTRNRTDGNSKHRL